MAMPAPDLFISKLGPESEPLLRSLLGYYIHDMAEWFHIDTEADGSYDYDMSLVWRNGHHAYLAKSGESIAGFALIAPATEWLGDIGAHEVHEFFILRRFRRCGLGQTLTVSLWNRHPGAWLVRVLEANAPAVFFWRAVIASYSQGSYEEETRISNGRVWLFFRFSAG